MLDPGHSPGSFGASVCVRTGGREYAISNKAFGAEKINLLNEQQITRQLYSRAKAQKTGFSKYSELQVNPNTLAIHVGAHFKTSINNPPIPETLSDPQSR